MSADELREAAAAAVARSRVDQGLAPTVDDAQALGAVAALIAAAPDP